MAKWEYKELNFVIKQRTFRKPHNLITEDFIQKLNEEGKKGWELVNTIHFNNSGLNQELKFILKREIISKDKSIF
jgi:hypothetical protein